MDKLVNSMIKSLVSMYNDTLTKEVISLYTAERSRRLAMNENLYLFSFIQLIDNFNNNCFRIHYSTDNRTMSIHLMDLPLEQNRKDYLETFKDYIELKLPETYTQLIEDNMSTEDRFTLFLERNIKLVQKKRKGVKPIVFENGLFFKVF
jgi:hypothetical protein